jgi:hypothetical protein
LGDRGRSDGGGEQGGEQGLTHRNSGQGGISPPCLTEERGAASGTAPCRRPFVSA